MGTFQQRTEWGTKWPSTGGLTRAFYNVGKGKKGARDYTPMTKDVRQMGYYFDMDQHNAFMNSHREVS